MSALFSTLLERRSKAPATASERIAGTPMPQHAGTATKRQLLDSLAAEPGLRLASSTGRRVYRGSSLATPQRFTRTPADRTGIENIDAARAQLAMARRSLPSTRVGGLT